MPGCEYVITLEPGDFSGSTAEELDFSPETVGEWSDFFAKATLEFNVNHYDYDMDPEELCGMLIEKGISGGMNVDELSQDRWYFDAITGEVELYIVPGV